MDRRTLIVGVVIGLAGNAVFALLALSLPNVSSLVWLLLIPTTIVAALGFTELHSIRRFGVNRIVRSTDEAFTLRRQIVAAKRSLDFMGVSARTIVAADTEALIKQKLLTATEFRLRFLVFDRNETDKLRRRAIEETGDATTSIEWSEAMASTIHTLLRIRTSLGHAGERLEVRTYAAFPVFRFIGVDDQLILLNYYERGAFPANLDHLELAVNDDPGLGRAFQKYFAERWDEATPAT